MGCDCVCLLRHPATAGRCDNRGVTIVWLGMDIRLCIPCTGPLEPAGSRDGDYR